MTSRRRRLSAGDEISLAGRIERGDLSAKEQMIESNIGLVFAVARSYSPASVAHADLVQEGTLGLLRAVDGFDYRRGLKFSTYAVWCIRRSILDAIGNSQIIRVPPKAKRHLAAVRRVEAELERTGPRHASDTAIAERTGLSATTVRSLRRAAQVTASLDQSIDDSTTPLGELIADERITDASDIAVAAEDRRELAAMLRLLPERHRQVLIRRYGLNQHREQTHQEIGEWLGVGEERSRQLEREALHRLRSVSTVSRRAA